MLAPHLATTRLTVPFNYAWRFHYGDDPTSPPGAGPGTCAFETDLQDFPICDGMEHNPNRFSEKDCRTACCYDPDCLVWQASPIEKGRACYHGYAGTNVTCSKGGKPSGMGGARRAHSPSPAFRTDYSFAADVTSAVDASWGVVDAPHDFIAERANFTDDSTNFKQGYLPRNASWYRKHFTLPAEWAGSGQTYVHFEGVFHHATLFLNGEYLQSHESGYTGFTVRLDNASGIRFGGGDAKTKGDGNGGGTNVLAVRADASFGSGHWYEGGGLYRPAWLTHVPPTHIVHDGLFIPPESDGSVVTPSAEVQLLSAITTATASTSGANVDVVGKAGGGGVKVRFTLLDGDKVLATNTSRTVAATATTKDDASPMVEATGSDPVTASAKTTTTILSAELRPAKGAVTLWSTQTPKMYTVRAEVVRVPSPASTAAMTTDANTDAADEKGAAAAAATSDAAATKNGGVVDALEVSVGLRTTEWRPGSFLLNGKPLKLRGFSHHNSIGGLGVAVPDRVNLFRAQASRALGSNIWRQSHNPYAPGLYGVLDALGTMCWDENRDYGAKYMGGAYAVAMRDMVKRDRNHPVRPHAATAPYSRVPSHMPSHMPSHRPSRVGLSSHALARISGGRAWWCGRSATSSSASRTTPATRPTPSARRRSRSTRRARSPPTTTAMRGSQLGSTSR